MHSETSTHDSAGYLKNGIVSEHFADGSLSSVGEYVNGHKTGEWNYYLRNGRLKARGCYRDGKMTGAWTWHRENGALMQTGSFADDTKVGSGSAIILPQCTTPPAPRRTSTQLGVLRDGTPSGPPRLPVLRDLVPVTAPVTSTTSPACAAMRGYPRVAA
jgi:hypothetical protein